ncbi:hypothetical protein [Sigmofec virus UA08Rod_5894]|uniref:Uncharacterized protein n=1 Tax=Sigmofec virus UA08Rod_5894 TaxID=2929443 RepID=A0A976N0H4_9VIRU|nr:hypothetical protein [Sigmofec virus UA08Rod_5894]
MVVLVDQVSFPIVLIGFIVRLSLPLVGRHFLMLLNCLNYLDKLQGTVRPLDITVPCDTKKNKALKKVLIFGVTYVTLFLSVKDVIYLWRVLIP